MPESSRCFRPGCGRRSGADGGAAGAAFAGVALVGRDGTLLPGLLAGFLFGSEFILIYIGFEYTTVSRGILFVYTMPFFVAAGAPFLIPGERLTPLRALGFCAAFAGVVLVFADRESVVSSEAWIGDLLCLIAALFWAATTMTIKTTRLRKVSAEKVLIYQLGVSALMGLALAPLFGPLIREITPVVVLAFVYQGLPGGGGLLHRLVLDSPPLPGRPALRLHLPDVGVLGAVRCADPSEPVTINLAAALVLVALGIYLVNRPRAGMSEDEIPMVPAERRAKPALPRRFYEHASVGPHDSGFAVPSRWARGEDPRQEPLAVPQPRRCRGACRGMGGAVGRDRSGDDAAHPPRQFRDRPRRRGDGHRRSRRHRQACRAATSSSTAPRGRNR